MERQYQFFVKNAAKNIKKSEDAITTLTSRVNYFKQVELLGYQTHVESYVSSFNLRIKKQNLIIKTFDDGIKRLQTSVNGFERLHTILEGRIGDIRAISNELNERLKKIEKLKFEDLEARIVFVEKAIVFIKKQKNDIYIRGDNIVTIPNK